MTINKFTFFSPNGNDYPVTANADAKLYQILGGFDYDTFGRDDVTVPSSVGLTYTYTNTSLVVAGRYIELVGELVALSASASNYIHVTIDLSTPANPVTLTVATADQSNTVDINSGSGVYKRCIDVVQTDGGGVIKVIPVAPKHLFKYAKVDEFEADNSSVNTLNVSGAVNFKQGFTVKNKGWIDDLQVYNSFITKTVVATETIYAGTTITGKDIVSKNKTTTNTLEIKGVSNQRSNQFKTPTVYSTINGTALQEFVLYRSANVITGNFADIKVEGGIPGAGAIIGWIQDNAFKPEYTQKFSIRTRLGKNFMLSVDPGGAFRNWGDPIPKGDEIFGGVYWICKGTEGGLR